MSKEFSGVMFTGGGGSERPSDDFYPTPSSGVVALLLAEAEHIRAHGVRIWEPACGDGAIVRVLQAWGFDTVATNLADRGFGETGVNFLEEDRPRAAAAITNPPFNLVEEFIRKGHELGLGYFALLLPSTYWHPTQKKNRDRLQRECPPSLALPLGFRLDFARKGAPVMSMTWYVFGKNRPGNPDFMKTTPALRKPA